MRRTLKTREKERERERAVKNYSYGVCILQAHDPLRVRGSVTLKNSVWNIG